VPETGAPGLRPLSGVSAKPVSRNSNRVNELLSKRLRRRGGRVWIGFFTAVAAAVIVYGGAAWLGARRPRPRRDCGPCPVRRARSAAGRRHDVGAGRAAAAESSLRQASLDYRLQRARLWPLPDLAPADASYRAAGDSATRAVQLTRNRRELARAASSEAIDLAAENVERSVSLAATIHLAASRKLLLTRARLALDEARVFHREGDFGAATLSATRSRDLATRVGDLAAETVARYADDEVIDAGRWKAEAIAWSRREGVRPSSSRRKPHRYRLRAG